MKLSDAFIKTRVFSEEDREYYFFGDEDLRVVKSRDPKFPDQLSLRVVTEIEGELVCRNYCFSKTMAGSFHEKFGDEPIRGWFKAVKRKNPKAQNRLTWMADAVERDPVPAEDVKAMMGDLEALEVKRAGAQNVGDGPDDIPF
jgi:hypothetical protein